MLTSVLGSSGLVCQKGGVSVGSVHVQLALGALSEIGRIFDIICRGIDALPSWHIFRQVSVADVVGAHETYISS